MSQFGNEIADHEVSFCAFIRSSNGPCKLSRITAEFDPVSDSHQLYCLVLDYYLLDEGEALVVTGLHDVCFIFRITRSLPDVELTMAD